MLDGLLKHRAGPAETVAGIEQAIDLRSIPRPLLDLVEVVVVGIRRGCQSPRGAGHRQASVLWAWR